jgi:hypothetical protein
MIRMSRASMMMLILVAAIGRPLPCHADSTTRPAGILSHPDFFPLAVWLQDPRNAEKYRDIGVNLYIGLWRGPTAAQLSLLRAARMHVICDQNTAGLVRRDDGVIVGWLQNDEPDNAQAIKGGGYGPPVPADQVIDQYHKLKQQDPAHPVFLNLGQGVAWDGWYGRGVRTNHPEDYAAYLNGCDIACFDIYPATHENPAIAGNLWYVGQGVKRLVDWTGGNKPVWCCIEAAGNGKLVPIAAQLRTEVWMAITSGATGIIYFCHQFKPTFIEAGLLANTELASGVKSVNAQVTRLSTVLHSPTLLEVVRAESSDPKVPVNVLCKRQGNSIYVFAVAMRNSATDVLFQIAGVKTGTSVEVLDESRTVGLADGRFTDHFGGYAVHLYRLKLP